jgi:hypothetical protein
MEGHGLTLPFEEPILQGLPLGQEVFILLHVISVPVYISSNSIASKLVQGNVNFYRAWVTSIKYPQGRIVGLSRRDLGPNEQGGHKGPSVTDCLGSGLT